MAARSLIVGASGLVGRRLLRALGPDRAVGTYHRHAMPGAVAFDMASQTLEDALRAAGERFSHLVILGALPNIDACARDPAGTARVNVAAACRLADEAAARSLFPIFASSDAIYDGGRSPWRETDETLPIIVYGRQKLEVETHLKRAGYPSLTLRIAKVLDPELDPAGVLGPWLADLRAGKPIRCATDQFFTPISLDDLVMAVVGLAESGASGTFNVGGDATSRMVLLETAVAAAREFGEIWPKIEPCRLNDLPFAERRPLDLRMATEKLRAAIGFSPEPFAALCRRAAKNCFAPPAGQG